LQIFDCSTQEFKAKFDEAGNLVADLIQLRHISIFAPLGPLLCDSIIHFSKSSDSNVHDPDDEEAVVVNGVVIMAFPLSSTLPSSITATGTGADAGTGAGVRGT